MKITRDIPLPWLIGYASLGVFHAISIWITVQQQVKQTEQLVVEMRELRNDARTGGLSLREHDIRLSDHERRIAQLEAKRP